MRAPRQVDDFGIRLFVLPSVPVVGMDSRMQCGRQCTPCVVDSEHTQLRSDDGLSASEFRVNPLPLGGFPSLPSGTRVTFPPHHRTFSPTLRVPSPCISVPHPSLTIPPFQGVPPAPFISTRGYRILGLPPAALKAVMGLDPKGVQALASPELDPQCLSRLLAAGLSSQQLDWWDRARTAGLLSMGSCHRARCSIRRCGSVINIINN